MIERLLYKIIKTGLDWYKEDDGQRFERFLINELRLEAAEAASARIYFAGGEVDGESAEARPPTLQHGYARTGGPFPLWTIILGAERESQTYLGEDATALDSEGNYFVNPETGEIVESKIRRVTYLFNIQCMADNPDITLYYYHLLKYIILSSHDAFMDEDIYSPTVGGMDLMPDPRYLPNDIFARQVTIEIEGEECWTEANEGTAFELSGIAIDDTGGGESAEPGSVAAKVTTYQTGS